MGAFLNKVAECFERFTCHDEAFGLPTGTIRGFVLIMLAGTVCYLSIVDKKLSETLATAFGLAIGFYYGKSTNPPAPPAASGTPA